MKEEKEKHKNNSKKKIAYWTMKSSLSEATP